MNGEWEPWELGYFYPPECGGHWYMHSDMQVTDIKRAAEKAHRSGGKWQVVHYHNQGEKCTERCEVCGDAKTIPRLAQGEG